MDNRKQQVNDFFDRYAARFNHALKGETTDIDGTIKSFAECFIEASPAGINCGKNDNTFRTTLPKGYDFYKKIGIVSMDIISKEIVLLDEYHVMTKIHWRSNFIKKDQPKGSIVFDVIYLLQAKESDCKIFAYITGDEQKALKENGLI